MSHQSLADGLQQRYGLRNARAEWLRRQSAFDLDVLVGPICRTDITSLTHGTLPWNILDAHSVQLGTRVLVQIEDVINIASSDPRAADAPRVLQFTLTDGHFDFVAVQLQPLPTRLSLRTLPGTKLVLHPTALVRRGRLLLTPADFTLLGSPTANVWGDAYDSAVDDALRAAHLRNPHASSFDSIAVTSRPAALQASRLPDMGGIADAVAQTAEDDDDDFWAQAAVLADHTAETNLGLSGVNGSVITNSLPVSARRSATVAAAVVPSSASMPPPFGNGAVHNRSVSRNGQPPHSNALQQSNVTLNTPVGTEMHAPPTVANSDVIDVVDLDSPEQRQRNASHSGVPNEFEDGSGQRVQIPEMPNLASEDVDDVDEDVVMGNIPITQDDATDIEIPQFPLNRLEQIDEARLAGLETCMYRGYCMRTKKKIRVEVKNGAVCVAAPIDDGSGIGKITLSAGLLHRLSGLDVNQLQQTHENSAERESVENRIRQSVRAISGFIHVQHSDDESRITNVSPIPPGGMVGWNSTHQGTSSMIRAIVRSGHLVDDLY